MTTYSDLEQKLNQSLAWMSGQRWFGDKDRSLRHVAIEHMTTAFDGTDPIQLCCLRCEFETGNDAIYFLPVVGSEGDDLRDAFTVEVFRTWFFRGFVDGREVQDGKRSWRWETLQEHRRDVQHVHPDTSTTLRLEQSNTSVVYDNRLILKVFRKLQSGPNPDVEIGQMLVKSGSEVQVPNLAGKVEFTEGDETTVLAILQQYVHNFGDGWGWLLEQLRNRNSGSVSAIALLGRRTAEMHTALATGSTEPAFAPEPITDEDLAESQRRIESELDQTIEGLLQRGALDSTTAESLQQRLRQKLTSLDSLRNTVRIRIHGDFHLGQVLRTVEHDFSIIDFEGEPSRPMNDRRKKWPALRDVAGMVRSLDYAVQTVLREQQDRSDLMPWRDEAISAFLNEYRSAIKPSLGIIPAADEDFASALAILSLEKALYETRYELSNRPDWLGIPLGALERIAGN